jgi:hypothetical protein
MTTADEYRKYAKECLKWADAAATDDMRQSFLDMASDWLLAATLLEDVLIPAKQAEQTSAQTPQP